jgi:hypothetical protein
MVQSPKRKAVAVKNLLFARLPHGERKGGLVFVCNDLERADLPTPDRYFVYCSPLTTTGGAENENQGYGCLRIA